VIDVVYPSDAVHLLPGPLDLCPACGASDLESVSDGTSTNFYCRGCGTCWHMELGYVHRVDATTCPGCEHRGACLLKAAIEGWKGVEDATTD
jgi:hypothetical protein